MFAVAHTSHSSVHSSTAIEGVRSPTLLLRSKIWLRIAGIEVRRTFVAANLREYLAEAEIWRSNDYAVPAQLLARIDHSSRRLRALQKLKTRQA